MTQAIITKSIGEVLALLKQEFDDITISKIRFLEGQGLIDPERTASGYRKFADRDVERLQFILRQQKDHFLPLKVIKNRLREREEQLAESSSSTEQSSETQPVLADATLSRSELIAASGLGERHLRELEGFGLIFGHKSSHGVWYGEEAVVIARLAARFLQYGVEARHLRTFKTASQREADLYKQLAGPVLGSRSTQARTEALARLDELHQLGESLRTELLRQALSSP